MAFVGGQPVYNTACGDNSYQVIKGTAPTGTGNTFRWEVSFSGSPYSTIVNGGGVPVNSADISKNDITNYVLTPAGNASGDYRIRRIVTNSGAGCSNTSQPVFLYYSQNASATSGGTITGDLIACSPASGTLTVSGNTGPVLQWESSADGGVTWTPINNNTNTLTYSGLTSGTCYRALVDNICTGSAGSIDASDKYSTTVCVTVNSIPAITVQPLSDGVCIGSSLNLSVTATSTTAMSYQWRKNGFDINGANAATFNIASVANSDAASYDVVITNSCGTVTSNAAVITVNPMPVATVPSNSVVCPGVVVPITAFSSSPGGASFTWTNSNPAIGLAAGGSGDVPSFTAANGTTSAIIATITVTPVLNDCIGPSSSYTIRVSPTAVVTVPADFSVCEGNTVSATNFSSTPAGATYTWTNSNTAIGLPAGGSGNVPSFTATGSGSATITVTPYVNGCAGTPSSYVITVNPLPTVSAIATDETSCGANNGTITITASGDSPLEYSINGGGAYSTGGTFSGLSPGSYAVMVKSSNGCVTAGPILTISSPGAPAAPDLNTTNSPVCEGQTIIVSVKTTIPGAKYHWTGPGGYTLTESTGTMTRPNADISMAGNYVVTVSDAECVSDAEPFTVVVNKRPIVNQPPDLRYCASSTVTASAFISTPAGATYSWINSNTAIGLAGSGSGALPSFTGTNTTNSPITATITVIPTLNGCAGDPVSFTITIDPLPVIVAVPNMPACHGSTIPEQIFTSNIPGATFAWTVTGLGATYSGNGSLPAFTAINNGTSPITGTVTVTANAGDCSGPSMSYQITVNPLPRITNAPLNQVTCAGVSTTEVVLTSDVAGATFSWTAVPSSGNITGFTASGTGNIPAELISNSGTVEGTVTYTIIASANGCPGPATTYVIHVNPPPKLLSSIALSQTVCSGSPSAAVNLSSEVTGTTFNWTTTVSGSITGFQSTGTNQTQLPSQTLFNTGTSPGTVTYTIVPISNGCSGPVSVYTILVNPVPTATISGDAAVCYGADATLNVALTGTAPWTITYSDGTGSFTIPNINTNSYSFSVSATSTKTYTIESVSDALCSNSGSGSATITQPSAPLAALAGSTNVSCFGAADGTITFTGVSGGSGSYQFSIDGGGTWQAGAAFTGLIPATYNLQVRDAGNVSCTFLVNNALVITQPAAPLTAAISGQTNVLCFGASTGSASVAASGGTAPYSYLWSNGVTQADLINVPAGTYTVNVSDVNGCTIGTALSVTITQPASALSAAANSINVSCFGGSDGSISLVSISGGSGTYEYSINGGIIWQGGTVFNNLAAGSYQVLVRDGSAPSCIFTVNASLTIGQPPALSALAAASNITCSGAADGTITISNISGGSGSYQYSIDNGAGWQNGNTFGGLAAGSYSVQMRDAVSPACVFIIDANLILSQPAVLSGTVEFRNVTCRGAADGSITVVNAAGGYGNYEYSKDEGISWQGSPVFSSLLPGTYHIQIRDLANPNCRQVLNSNVIIREAAEPLVSGITGIVNIDCFGSSTGAVALFVRGGVAPYTYAWSNGMTSRDIRNVPAGTYSVTITDSYNCISMQTVIINQPSEPISISFSKNDVKCFGESNGSVSLTVSGGTAPYRYIWSNGRTTKDLINLTAGTYTVTITDAKACSQTQEITIGQPVQALALSVAKTNVSCFGGADGVIDLTVSGGTAPYSYNWSTGQRTASLNGIPQGSYSVTILDANGCSLTRNVTITQPSAPLRVSLTVKNTVCRTSSDGMLTAVVSGGTAPYRLSWKDHPQTSNVLSGLPAGLYEINVTDALGCTFSASAEVIAGVCPPVAVDDPFKTYEDAAVSGTTAPNDFDRESLALTFSLAAQPENGSIIFRGDGSFTYTPVAGYWGTEVIPYKICNTAGVCNTANLIIQVVPYTIVHLTPAISNVTEGRKITITARLEKPYKDDAVIKIAYSGAAIRDRDYALLDQYMQLLIPKGQLVTTQKITVAALTDDIDEDEEIINVQIASTSDPEVRIGRSAIVVIGDVYPPVISDLVKDSEPLPNPDIKIDPLFSPNGDGLGNDTFIIENIVSFPDNEVRIFNRWGNEVFTMNGYDERERVFKGYANTGMLTNTNVPLVDGVYYYLIKTRRTLNGEVITAINKGYLILKR
ncbi:MAG: PKD-like domain-containing protein [Daejeonella sp.]